MTIYINGYNRQFQNFVDFATEKMQAGKRTSIARLDDTVANLGEHKITAAKGGVGGFSALFRTKAKEAVNNATRENFKKAIIDLFGGASKVPDSVLDAMKLEDFGKGKPLTARRIMAVKRAIDDVKTKFDTAFQTAKAKVNSEYLRLNEEGKAQMDDRIRNIITSCIEDPDLLDVVTNNMDSILVGGDGKHRTGAAIKKKIDGLKANYRELREFAKDNPAILEHGKFFIAAMNGKTIPQGMIRTIIEATKEAPIDALTKLSTSSSGYGIHKAMNQFRNGINDIMNKADVENLMDGTDEKVACRDFATQILIARCGKGAARKMQTALNGETAAKTLKLYNDISNGGFDKKGMSKGLISAAKDQGVSHETYLNQLKQAVDIVCGIPRDEFIPLDAFEGEINYAKLEGDRIFTELTQEAQKQLAATRENYLKNTIQGTGKGVTELRNVIDKKLGLDVTEPREVIRKDARVIAKNMINWTLMADCKRFAEGKAENTLFHKDLARGIAVKLPGGKQLSNDFATACDEIAQFVTGKADATYAGLEGTAKTKAHIVMSLLSQDTMKAATESNLLTLDPNKNKVGFILVTPQDLKDRVFTLEMTPGGGLFVNFKANLDLKGFTILADEEGKFTETGKGSKYNSMFSLQINTTELDRLAQLDFTKFDDKAALDVFDKAEADKIGTTVNSFDQLFKLDKVNASCDTTFDITLK